MRLLGTDGRLTHPARMLLSAASGVDASLLEQVRVYPKERNWLRFPWYPAAQGGGAFVMGGRIYAHRKFFAEQEHATFLFLLAHEVGHLPHAEPFGFHSMGRARFVLWAAGHYLRSALRHGRHAHRLARIEQEAERGRWVLAQLLRRTQEPLSAILSNEERMRSWLQRHEALLRELHRSYPGWPLDQR
ncbi:MAG: hypothetical protein KF797_03660 [Flavobacteriales bacterium]|nr:hypothetical protein [Flavobacteriales bacterium]